MSKKSEAVTKGNEEAVPPGDDLASSMSGMFDDIFGDFAGRRSSSTNGGAAARQRGADLRYNLELTLEDAYAGRIAQIAVPTNVVCEKCHGSGAKPGSIPTACRTCGGRGRVTTGRFFTGGRVCSTCEGLGTAPAEPCEGSGGTGRRTKGRTLSVNIPAGLEHGTRIRLAGEGDAGLGGGPAGDLYINFSIKPHARLTREGADLFCKVQISATLAATGGEIEVPTADGGVFKVRLAEWTRGRQDIRLEGKGMPVLRSSNFGDMYVEVRVEGVGTGDSIQVP